MQNAIIRYMYTLTCGTLLSDAQVSMNILQFALPLNEK